MKAGVVKIRFVGCGDAFGSGGRFNTCFHVTGRQANFLIDCGASSVIALKTSRVALSKIDIILITHFHADHFGGIPFFVLDAQFFSKRTRPLTIAGPQGLTAWYEWVMETGFPGSSKTKQGFDLSLVELPAREPTQLGHVRVTPFPVDHSDQGSLCYAYRIQAEGRVIAYTGDTGWTETLIEVGRKADIFIAEAYFYDKKVRHHLDLVTLTRHLPLIQPKRLVLTHMSDDMLARLDEIPYEVAEDGKILKI
jgi:ribonuclease BN (tRNA processing enzyme)